jgi:phenylacetate-coenzyme A ligase PaaK-like adenylate-forming protein
VYQGATSQGAPAWARALLDIHVVAHDATLEAILADVDRIAPAFLFGLPSRLEWLAMAQLGGRLHIGPAVIFVGGETLHASLIDLYKRAWPDCRIVNTYGTTETKAIATACPECSELHVCEDIVHFELRDERGAPCAPGAEAHAVLATSLRNLTVPVIRYEITDRILALPDVGCRWRTQRIQVRGREPAFLWVKSARNGTWTALNGRMLKESLTALEGACGFAVKHPESDRLDVTIVVIDGAKRDAAVASARALVDRFVREHGCETSDVLGRVDLRAVDADEWNRAGGKLQSIVSSVEPPELAAR